jgi:DNA mismatch repair protein MutS
VTHKKITPKTLFATHYHELQTLENQHPQKIKNYHMAIEKFDGEPVFLHTLVRGSAAQSYGISVAKLAGLPNAVIERAYILQRELEKSKSTIPTKMDTEKFENQNTKNEKIVKNLQKININSLTPLEALNILSEIKSKIER